MKILRGIFACCMAMLLLLPVSLQAQCTGGIFSGTLVPTGTYQTAPTTGGRYYEFAANAGDYYDFSFCSGGGSSTWDTQITILDGFGNPATGGYNDDFCGLQSELSWTATGTGTFRVLVTEFNCINNASPAFMAYRTRPGLPPGTNGTDCANPYTVPSLPFSLTGQTTQGYGNDYDDLDACGSLYMNGDDFVFEYTSAGSEAVTISLSNTSTWVGLFVMDGCPDAVGTTCLPTTATGGCGGTVSTSGVTASGGNPSGTWDLTAPGTYYIVISTFPSPQYTPFDISIVSSPITTVTAGTGCYSISNIPYTPEPFGGTPLTFPDDEFSNPVSLGFNFCFMGTQYSSCVVSSNGYISFNPGCSAEYSPWNTDTVPQNAPAEVRNSIMGPWQDIDPNAAGGITYQITGVAPNRKFVVSYSSVDYFGSSCTGLSFSGQIVLHEGTNIIDNFITNKPVCTGWNNGEAVQGLLDATGTVAVMVPGRNNTQWTTTLDGKRFTPTCPICTTPLPLEIAELSGFNEGEKNVLKWTTAYEDNISRFVIESSRDGSDFAEIDEVLAKGNTSSEWSYEAEDLNPAFPSTWYRLKYYDYSGEYHYSEVIQVNLEPLEFYVYAVTEDVFEVKMFSQLESTNAYLTVLDEMGREVYNSRETMNPGANTIQLDLSSLGTGIYFLKVTDGKSFRKVKKFVKS